MVLNSKKKLKSGVPGIKIENGELPRCFIVGKRSPMCSLGTAAPGTSCATHVSTAKRALDAIYACCLNHNKLHT